MMLRHIVSECKNYAIMNSSKRIISCDKQGHNNPISQRNITNYITGGSAFNRIQSKIAIIHTLDFQAYRYRHKSKRSRVYNTSSLDNMII
jgi:hypothetical protein